MSDDLLDDARDAARRLFDTGALGVDDWHDLSWEDRQRLAVDVTMLATALREAGPRPSEVDDHLDGPGADAVRTQLGSPTGEVHLQPIVRLPGRQIVGYEALSRFPAWAPDLWFRRAWAAGLGLEFEIAAVARAVDNLRSLPDNAFLGINVSASTLVSDVLVDELKHADGRRVVLELTEHEPIRDYSPYCEQIGRLRALGVRIAIDDVGAGHSSLLHIVQLRPDVIKLDRSLIAGCDGDPIRRVLMQCFVTLARQAQAALVAEGVETEEEAHLLSASGVRLAQGFLFGAARQHPVAVSRAASQ
ncbi:MAG: EAL domain-containing protein [Acidimicrobiia bacterium]|nr:EAL domain-containing protein [Acidimicrobiia bacterium]